MCEKDKTLTQGAVLNEIGVIKCSVRTAHNFEKLHQINHYDNEDDNNAL